MGGHTPILTMDELGELGFNCAVLGLDTVMHAAKAIEDVLVDMKSKSTSEWTGNIYSRDSGDTYYATMTLKDPNTIEVRACALWRFWCSGNAWSRIPAPKRLVSYRQL